MPRALYENTESTIHFNHGNEIVCCFVHGLAGDKSAEYWGNLSILLSAEEKLADVDFVFWQYNSNRSVAPNILKLIRRGKRLSTVPDVSYNLCEFLDALQTDRNYRAALIIGHSLGSHIAILATTEINESGCAFVKSVLTTSMPETISKASKFWARFWSLNPHVRWLRSEAPQQVVTEKIPQLIESGIPVDKMHGSNDEIAKHISVDGVTTPKITQLVHSWVSQIDTQQSHGYRQIRNWIYKMKSEILA